MAAKRSAETDTAKLGAVVDEWLHMQSSANTRAAYRSDLGTFGRWCSSAGTIALTADTATITAFQTAREAAGDSDSTMRRRWSSLASFYDFAVSSGCAPVNPVRSVARPKVFAGDPSPTPRLSAQAVASYRAMAAALDPRLEALVALLVTDGLKVGEALALDVADVSNRSAQTTIRVRRRGKDNRIVLAVDTAKAIRRCVGARRNGPVFINERSRAAAGSQRLSRFGADHLIRQLRSDDDAAPVTANALRRFHFTHSQDNGNDAVRDRGGLADIRSIRRYTPRRPPGDTDTDTETDTAAASRESVDRARDTSHHVTTESRPPTSRRRKK